MKLADKNTAQKIDETSMKSFSIHTLQLMENAGHMCALEILKNFPPKKTMPYVIVCGKGNNGGDGYVIARHLYNKGVKVKVFSTCAVSKLKGDARVNADIWKKMKGNFTVIEKANFKNFSLSLSHSESVIDCILGVGINKEVKGIYKEVIEKINLSKSKVVSIDTPSGMDVSNGKILGVAIKADVTLTMALPKIGFYIYPGKSYVGKIKTIDIGVPRELVADAKIKNNLIDETLVKKTFKEIKTNDTHKGTFGHVLLIGGSRGKSGAIAMTGLSALRTGAGLTTVAVPESINNIVEKKTMEVMTLPLEDDDKGYFISISAKNIDKELKNKKAVAIGPGIGTNNETKDFIKEIIKRCEANKLPIVIDADGLNNLKDEFAFIKKIKTDIILTPHVGEGARLLNKTNDYVKENLLVSAMEIAKKTNSICVLKSASTIIALPNGEIFINTTGSVAMSTAGTGDVLTGIIAGLLSQGYSAIDSAMLGVYVHGKVSDALSKNKIKRGIIATDLIKKIPHVINDYL